MTKCNLHPLSGRIPMPLFSILYPLQFKRNLVEFRVHVTEVNTSDSRRENHTCWFEVKHVLEEESAQCQLIVASQLGRILPNCNQERGEDRETIHLSVCMGVCLPVSLSVYLSVV